jgi:predicted TIM-barrel fold metal-dependent hydrolase
LLADYENMYADLSAGSGLGALSRDEEFTRGFLQRHRKKLLFATDCPCRDGHGQGYEPGCFGRKLRPLLERLVEDEETLQDLLHDNVLRVLGQSDT